MAARGAPLGASPTSAQHSIGGWDPLFGGVTLLPAKGKGTMVPDSVGALGPLVNHCQACSCLPCLPSPALGASRLKLQAVSDLEGSSGWQRGRV